MAAIRYKIHKSLCLIILSKLSNHCNNELSFTNATPSYRLKAASCWVVFVLLCLMVLINIGFKFTLLFKVLSESSKNITRKGRQGWKLDWRGKD